MSWNKSNNIRGPTGLTGPAGPMGPAGPTGAMGSAGIPGAAGTRGDTTCISAMAPSGPSRLCITIGRGE